MCGVTRVPLNPPSTHIQSKQYNISYLIYYMWITCLELTSSVAAADMFASEHCPLLVHGRFALRSGFNVSLSLSLSKINK